MEASAVKKLNDSMKTVKKAAADTKGKDDKARLDTDAETLQKSIDTSQKDLDDSKKSCKDVDGKLAKVVDESAAKIEKLTKKIEDSKKTVESTEKEAKATIVTLPGGKEEVEKAFKKEEEEKKADKEIPISPSSITIPSGKKGKSSTGKPIAPRIPAPPREEKVVRKDKEGKVIPSEGKVIPREAEVIPAVPVPVSQIIKKKVL